MRRPNGSRADDPLAPRSIQAGLLAMLLAAVAACGGATPSPSPTTSPVMPTQSAEATSNVTPAPTSEPTTAPPTVASTPAGPFASTIYPYTLELPAGVLTRQWKPAVFAWDGETRFGTDSRAVDITGTVDGTLLIFGLPWDGDIAGFMDLISTSAARFHGCGVVGERMAFEVNGVAGLSEHEVCAQGTLLLSTVLAKDGYGLAVRVMVNADKVDVVFDRVVTWLDGLTWVAS